MPFEPWQIQVLQEKGLADAEGDLVLAMLKNVEKPELLTHAVVRKAEDKYVFLSPSGWTPIAKAAVRTTKDAAAALAAKRKREGAEVVVLTEKLAPEAIQRLFAADQSPDHRWADWIFEQAGGGNTGREQSEHHINYLKSRFIHQYSAEAWAQTEPAFRESMRSADQDVCMKMRGSFGYYRNWPGREGIYERVVTAVELFQKQEPALTEMNQELEAQSQSGLPAHPSEIDDLKNLTEINTKVTNWIAAKRVRTDYRVATWKKEKTIYSDDYVTAIAPLTYAAAVKYGFDSWDVASRAKFAKVAQGDIHSNPWDSFIQHGTFMVFLQFNVPMPRWVGRGSDSGEQRFKTYELGNLLIALDRDTAKSDPNTWTVTDEENNKTLTIGQIKDIITRQGRREAMPEPPAPRQAQGGWQPRPAEPHPLLSPTHAAKTKDWPIKPGGPAVPSEQEAQQILSHLDACLQEVQAWAAKFDPSKMARVIEK